ncbi:hypothetical protein [Pontibacter sp. H249]|uniref:hypothetical protein n=1 Tax=Pontibacter sp. H249 TaxID=3133420 RepID=UPI0030C27616
MQKFNPSTIFYTPDALNERGKKVLLSYPDAGHTEIAQHNRLPALGVIIIR